MAGAYGAAHGTVGGRTETNGCEAAKSVNRAIGRRRRGPDVAEQPRLRAGGRVGADDAAAPQDEGAPVVGRGDVAEDGVDAGRAELLARADVAAVEGRGADDEARAVEPAPREERPVVATDLQPHAGRADEARRADGLDRAPRAEAAAARGGDEAHDGGGVRLALVDALRLPRDEHAPGRVHRCLQVGLDARPERVRGAPGPARAAVAGEDRVAVLPHDEQLP